MQATCNVRLFSSFCGSGRQWSRHLEPRGSKCTGYLNHTASQQTQQKHYCNFVVSLCKYISHLWCWGKLMLPCDSVTLLCVDIEPFWDSCGDLGVHPVALCDHHLSRFCLSVCLQCWLSFNQPVFTHARPWLVGDFETTGTGFFKARCPSDALTTVSCCQRQW